MLTGQMLERSTQAVTAGLDRSRTAGHGPEDGRQAKAGASGRRPRGGGNSS